MSAIYPIPTRRSSDLLVQTRLLSQLQSDQLDLLKIQTQISTGRRISRPSEDPAAATRGIGLQRVLEEKSQVRTNLSTTSSYLSATDSALSSVSDLIAQMRGVAIGSAQTVISDSTRKANAVEVQRAIQRLVEIGNHSFRGRYLFSGSRTTAAPFAFSGAGVAYSGNETLLRSYADVNLLFENNVPGTEVFGAISPAVRGAADLNPIIARKTRLADLRGGLGISSGSIQISDGTNTETIDLSSAKSIDDVARAIERQPPTGRIVTVRVTATGLTLDLDDAGGGNLTVSDVGDGTTAAELGILNRLGTGIAPLIGTDLDPQIRLTTKITDILGTRPTAYVASGGSNNDLIVESLANGTATNGVTIQFVDDGLLHASLPLVAGNETVSYSAVATTSRAALKLFGLNNNLLLTAATPGTNSNNIRIDIIDAGAIGNNATVSYNAGTRVLTLGIDSAGATTAQTLINQVAAQGQFSAAYDASDPVDGGFIAAAPIPISNVATGIGNTGNSGGDAGTLFVNIEPGRSTANHVVAAINNDPLVQQLFQAQLDPSDTSANSQAGRGMIDVNAAAQTSGGTGQNLDQVSGLRIVNGGQTFTADISAARSIEDLLNLLNRSGANVTASINSSGSGLDVRSNLSGTDFSIGENGGTTATQLGIRSLSASTSLSDLNYGRGVTDAAGNDFRIQRTDGVVLNIDIASAATVQDVLDLINAGGGVNARLADLGNGIVVEDTAAGAGSLVITKETTSAAIWELGLIPVNQGTATGTGIPPSIAGTDSNPQEVKGVFNSLQRLHSAILAGNVDDVERVVTMLDDDLARLTFSRSRLGAQQQGLDALRNRLEDEEVELRRVLSVEIDTDLPQAISEMAGRQAALQASLQLTSRVFQLTLLDFL